MTKLADNFWVKAADKESKINVKLKPLQNSNT